MKRIKATAEIKELKELIRWQREKIIKLENKIDVLEDELIESKSKEGKGALETAMESISNLVNSICDAICGMPPDELEDLIIQNNDDEDGDSDAI